MVNEDLAGQVRELVTTNRFSATDLEVLWGCHLLLGAIQFVHLIMSTVEIV